MFLVDAGGYLADLAGRELSGQLDYSDRNHIRQCFRLSQCGSTAFTPSGRAIQPAHTAGSDALTPL